jgi:ankyrin repeat protein
VRPWGRAARSGAAALAKGHCPRPVTGNLDLVQVLLDHDADIETMCSGRQGTPIMHAAHNGHADIIRFLVRCGANLEARDVSHLTACMIASSNNRSSAVDALLRAGAQVDAQDIRGFTALHLAALSGSVDSIHLLVAAKADVNIKDAEGKTALDLANESGRSYVIQALVHAGAKVMLKIHSQGRSGKVGGRSGHLS